MMAARASFRGNAVQWDSNQWCYSSDGEPVDYHNERPCARCGKPPTAEGYDACLGHVPGVQSACCGHGVEDPYRQPGIDPTEALRKRIRELEDQA